MTKLPEAVELHEDEPTVPLRQGDKLMVSQTVELDSDGEEARVVEQHAYIEGDDGVLHVYPDFGDQLERE